MEAFIAARSFQILTRHPMRNGIWRLLAIVTLVLGLTGVSARADDGFYTFTSALSTPSNNFCIDVPGSDYRPDKGVWLFACARTPNQTFQLANGSNLTAGGLCLDSLAASRGRLPGAGDPVVLEECDGSDHQVWELEAFTGSTSLFLIVDPAGLCVTVNGATAAARTPLVLAQCAELPNQGWLQGGAARPIPVRVQGGGVHVVEGYAEIAGFYVGGYAGYEEPEYYWYSGQRYCWYDDGWHGPGWYVCGESLHDGLGWGGPIGWHFWYHFGHRWLNHRVFFAAHHGMPPHQHDVAAVATQTGMGGSLNTQRNQGGMGNQAGMGAGGGLGARGGLGAGGQSAGGGGSGKMIGADVNTGFSNHVNMGIKSGGSAAASLHGPDGKRRHP
jgi:hypothetical protein